MKIPTDPNELQRQLEQANAENAKLKSIIQQQRSQQQQQQQWNANTSQQLNAGQHSFALPQSPHNGVYNVARSSALARSQSTMSYPTQTSVSTMERDVRSALPQAHKRQRRALSQQSAPAQSMARSASNRSESGNGTPFIQTGPIAPLTPSTPASITRFYASRDEPANQSLLGGPNTRLPSVQEDGPLTGVGMNPSDFLALNNWDVSPDNLLQDAQPFSHPNISYDAFNLQFSSACPSMISGSSAPDTGSPLTRQNSAFDNISADMSRLTSAQSQSFEHFPQESVYSSSNPNGKRPADHVLIGLGASLPQTSPHQYASAHHSGSLLSSPDSANMERSISSTSMTSAKSSSSNLERRAKEARERVLQASQITLAPKAHEALKTAANSSTKKEPKVAVNKSNYQRPKHPKVHCTQCEEHPEGFRGEHELRRHVMAKHEGTVRKFVCRDPATVGEISPVQVINPLSKCKACVSGKHYGAYYNAAAHLRRTHFKPKTGRGKKGGAEEKRGGKAGGDWPSMQVLKLWFHEVQVAQQDIVDQDEADDEAMDAEMAGTTPESNMEMFTAGIGSNLGAFDLTGNLDFNIDGSVNTDAMLGLHPGLPLSAPISSGSNSFSYSPYTDNSPMDNLGGDYSFSEESLSTYSSNANTVTPTMFQELNLADNMWTA